jgi:hypothetical protein
MATKSAGMSEEATRQSTAARAYSIWESEGRPHGRDVQHWIQAEAETRAPARRRSAASKSGTKMPPKVAAAMTAATGAASKTTKKSPTGSRKKS